MTIATFSINCCGELHCITVYGDFDVYLANHLQNEIESQLALHELGADLCPCVDFLSTMKDAALENEDLEYSFSEILIFNVLHNRYVPNYIRFRFVVDVVEDIIRNSPVVRKHVMASNSGLCMINSIQEYIMLIRNSGYKLIPGRIGKYNFFIMSKSIRSDMIQLGVFISFLKDTFHDLNEKELSYVEKGLDSFDELMVDHIDFIEKLKWWYFDLVAGTRDMATTSSYYEWIAERLSRILEDAAREAGCEV